MVKCFIERFYFYPPGRLKGEHEREIYFICPVDSVLLIISIKSIPVMRLFIAVVPFKLVLTLFLWKLLSIFWLSCY